MRWPSAKLLPAADRHGRLKGHDTAAAHIQADARIDGDRVANDEVRGHWNRFSAAWCCWR